MKNLRPEASREHGNCYEKCDRYRKCEIHFNQRVRRLPLRPKSDARHQPEHYAGDLDKINKAKAGGVECRLDEPHVRNQKYQSDAEEPHPSANALQPGLNQCALGCHIRLAFLAALGHEYPDTNLRYTNPDRSSGTEYTETADDEEHGRSTKGCTLCIERCSNQECHTCAMPRRPWAYIPWPWACDRQCHQNPQSARRRLLPYPHSPNHCSR